MGPMNDGVIFDSSVGVAPRLIAVLRGLSIFDDTDPISKDIRIEKETGDGVLGGEECVQKPHPRLIYSQLGKQLNSTYKAFVLAKILILRVKKFSCRVLINSCKLFEKKKN